MCFSAPASFTASAVLAVVGGAALSKSNKQTRPYALIPIFFSIQQAFEGMQWLAIQQGAASLLLGYLFIGTAFLFWPIYIPWCVLRMENEPSRRKRIRRFLRIGIAISFVALLAFFVNPLSVESEEMHIVYDLRYSFPIQMIWASVYIITLCGAALASSHRYVKAFGAAAFVSLVVSIMLSWNAAASIWCYFCAVLSALVLVHVWTQREKGVGK